MIEDEFQLVIDKNERRASHVVLGLDQWFAVSANRSSSNTTLVVCQEMYFRGATVIGKLAEDPRFQANTGFSMSVPELSNENKNVFEWYDALGWSVRSCNGTSPQFSSLACSGM